MMNERIKELAKQSGALVYDAYTDFSGEAHPVFISTIEMDVAKFAELIVKECVAQIRKQPIGDEVLGGQHFKTVQLGETIATIEELFGIKE